MSRDNTRIYWILSSAFFCFFLAWSFSFLFFPVWLHKVQHLNGSQIGKVFAINGLIAMAVMPIYGYLQDRLGFRKHLLLWIAGNLLFMGPFFQFLYGPMLNQHFLLIACLGGLYFALTFYAGVCALESYIERISRKINFEFGKARMWGSLGWATASLLAGRLFNITPYLLFWITSGCALFFMLALLAVKVMPSSMANPVTAPQIKLDDSVKLLKSPAFWRLAVYIMGVFCVYNVFEQQFPVYYVSFFNQASDGQRLYGYLNSLQVLLEALGMFLAPAIINRIGAKNGLLLSGSIMAIRIIGSGYAEGIYSISLLKLLHAIELPIVLVSSFKYIVANFDQRLSATLYLVGFQFLSQLWTSPMAIGAGIMYDTFGFATTYKIMGVVILTFILISRKRLSGGANSPSELAVKTTAAH